MWLTSAIVPDKLSENKFAKLVYGQYKPRRPRSQEKLCKRERLWLFLTIKSIVEKNKLLNLKFVKHSSILSSSAVIDE